MISSSISNMEDIIGYISILSESDDPIPKPTELSVITDIFLREYDKLNAEHVKIKKTLYELYSLADILIPDELERIDAVYQQTLVPSPIIFPEEEEPFEIVDLPDFMEELPPMGGSIPIPHIKLEEKKISFSWIELFKKHKLLLQQHCLTEGYKKEDTIESIKQLISSGLIDRAFFDIKQDQLAPLRLCLVRFILIRLGALCKTLNPDSHETISKDLSNRLDRLEESLEMMYNYCDDVQVSKVFEITNNLLLDEDTAGLDRFIEYAQIFSIWIMKYNEEERVEFSFMIETVIFNKSRVQYRDIVPSFFESYSNFVDWRNKRMFSALSLGAAVNMFVADIRLFISQSNLKKRPLNIVHVDHERPLAKRPVLTSSQASAPSVSSEDIRDHFILDVFSVTTKCIQDFIDLRLEEALEAAKRLAAHYSISSKMSKNYALGMENDMNKSKFFALLSRQIELLLNKDPATLAAYSTNIEEMKLMAANIKAYLRRTHPGGEEVTAKLEAAIQKLNSSAILLYPAAG